MNKYRSILTLYNQSWQEKRLNFRNQIRYYNFWEIRNPEEVWFSRFITSRKLLNKSRCKINFFSVLGHKDSISKLPKGINIFYTGENLNNERFKKYLDIWHNDKFDLKIGYDHSEDIKVLRLPLWILYMFEPESDFKEIKERVNKISIKEYDDKKKFCSIVASHDWNGIRGEIIDALASFGEVKSGGIYRNNTSDLKRIFNDNKINFIKQFIFNICPENSDYPGYVTEKIFQAFEAGCIPIYWGSENNPESQIINKNAVLFWEKGKNNNTTLKLIDDILHYKKIYAEYFELPRLLPTAPEAIFEIFSNFEKKIRELISSE